jgi:hypothetical protein
MKNNFQSKAVPRGTRTIWRYLSALFLLFTFAIGNVWGTAPSTIKVPGSTFTLPTLNSSWTTWKGAIDAPYVVKHDTLVFNANEVYQTLKMSGTPQPWGALTGGGTSSGDWNAIGSFVGSANWKKEGTAVNTYATVKSETDRIFFFRVTNCIGACALVKSGSNKKRTIYLEAYEVDGDGNPAASPAKSTSMESSTLGAINISGLDAAKNYVITIYANCSGSGGSSSGNSNLFEFALVSAPAASYTVTLNPNEGGYASTPDGWTADGSNIKKTVSAGALTIPEPTRATYTFNGWKSGVTAVTLTDGKLTVAKDTTLVAQWLAPCAATAPGDITKGALTAGEITLTAGGSAAEGDTWYWQDAADGTATDKGTGASKTVDAAGTYYVRSYNVDGDCWSVAKSITLEAEDFIAHYAITYNPGTGGSGSIAAGDKTQDVAFTLSSEMFTRTGYVQVGWALSDGGTKAYDLGGSYTDNKAQEFFPVWAEKDTYAAAFACSASAPAGWTFSTDDGWADNKTIAAYVCKFTENSVPAPGNNGMNENWVAFAKNTSAVATYDLGYATTVSALNVTLYGGSSSAFNQTIEFVGADGTTVKKSYTNSLGAGNWAANNITKTDVVPNVRYIKVYGASKWVVMSAFSVTYGDLSTKYTVTYSLNGGTGTTPTQSALAAGKTFTLHDGTTGITAPTDKIFSNWKDQDDALFAGSAEYTMPAKNVTLTAQWVDASSTYSVTYNNGGHGTAPDAESAVAVVLTELSAVGWAHKGWTANVDVTVDAATVEAGTLIANGKTAILASDVTFTAVWSEIFTVTYNANGGTCETASATWTEGDAALVLPTATKDNWDFVGWYDAAIDGNKIANPYSPSATIELFAHYMPKLVQAIYSNTFDAFIKNQAVDVYYLQGESQPTLSSIKVLGQESPVYEEVDGNIKVTIETVDYIFPVTKTAVAPHVAGTGDQETFDGTETYIKTGYTYSSGWRFSKTDSDWSRESDGRTRLYFFLGAADHFTLESTGTSRAMKVYRNGVLLDEPTASGSNPSIAGSNVPAMYAIVSNQNGGDGKFTAITLAPWVPVTAVTLKEGEDPISSKEIWESTSFTLTAEVTPDNASDKTITWTSSNNDVATVVNGVVTGVAANATPVTITASTVDGVTATCEVTVTAAPEPSADPVITAQPASANYYEGATIAALEVVATGESLSYQWYLGADAISGAESATYTPTVSAIGSYEYHCVVTNTEAGKLPTSLASDNATITIAEDPSAIKLINKSTGAINTTNFITGVTANDNVHGENGAVFGSSSSNASVKGLSGLNKVVVYNATTTQTKIKLVLYNTNSAAQEVVLSTMAEGDVDPVGQAISVPSKELYSTGYITYNSTKNRTFYLHTKSTNVQISQIQVIESGEELAVAGKKDYSLNLNKGRVYAYASSAQTWEGLSMNLGSNYSPATTEYITFKDNALSFSVPNDVCLTITPARAGDKYYVTDVADGTDNATTTVAGTPNSFDLTGGVGKVWYIRSQGSNVQLTNIAFSAPRCAEPAFNALTNSDICSGDPYVALDGTATVADLGTPTYKWYAEGADESDPAAILGTDATYTPTADGKYYVIATNHKEGFADNEKKSDLVTVTTYASAEITTAPADVRQTVGENATLTVVATGKAPLSYQWYTCDENGDNAVLIAGAEEDTYTVNVTADFDQFYKVVVTSGCGEASAVAHVVEWRALPQLKVNASTTWDWVNAGENIKLTGSTAPKKNEECVMANVKVGSKMPTNDDTFNSQALLFYGENVRAVDGGRAYASVGYIKFTTTVAGKVTVEFSTNTDDKVRCVKINGVASETSDKKATVKTFSTVVPAGEVSLVGYEEETANAYIRISKIIFDATDVSDADYTRDVTEGRYGTICVPNGGIIVGADIFELAYYGATSQKFFFDEIASAEMEAGKPYLFFPHEGATQLGVYYTDSENKSGLTVNGFVGFIGADADAYTQVPANDNCYIISNNLYRQVQTGAEAYILSNRAYIDMTKVTNVEPAKAPGARRIGLGVQGKDQAQGFENIETGDAPMKVMINGTMYILRGEKVYDATGRLVK